MSTKPIFHALFAATLLFASPSGPAQAAAQCKQTHIVQRGDTLSKIAKQHLGSVFSYPAIHDLNRRTIGRNPNRLRVGTTLHLPCKGREAGGLNWSVLLGPDALYEVARQSDLQVLDIRKEKYLAEGTLKNAVWVPYENWRGPKENPGQPPSDEQLTQLIGNAGLLLDKPIVVMNQGGDSFQTGQAAFVYWLLKSSGATQLSLLRGGFSGWAKAGHPVVETATTPEPYAPIITFDRSWRAGQIEVYGLATNQVSGALLDARPHSFFQRLLKKGKVPTTLPSAGHLPTADIKPLLSGDMSTAQGVEIVMDNLRSKGVKLGEEMVVSFCSDGALSALNWFYASELAGIENVRLYPESVKGWSLTGGLLTPFFSE